MLIEVPSRSFNQAFPRLRCRNAFVQALRVSAPGCTKEQYNTEGLVRWSPALIPDRQPENQRAVADTNPQPK